MCKQYFRNDYCGNVARPNQSLKLTEPAVGDFAARQKIFSGNGDVCRAYSLHGTGCTSPQLSSGPLDGITQHNSQTKGDILCATNSLTL